MMRGRHTVLTILCVGLLHSLLPVAAAVQAPALPEAIVPHRLMPLFNGKDLSGWKPDVPGDVWCIHENIEVPDMEGVTGMGSPVDEVFARIPEGWFQMGSDEGPDEERPVHRVWVEAFEFAVYPVTCRAYALFLRASGHEPPRDWPLFSTSPDRPVVGVSWFDCQAYCRWRASEGSPLRLPTEAEWERAARGGIDGQRYPWGNAVPAWIPEGGRGPLEAPWPVTLGEPNPFGLFGIAANVHEWCADWYSSDSYRVSASHQPAGPEAGVRRASRGGSWRHAVTMSRCAARSRLDPSYRYTDYGFRVARLG